MAPSNQPPDRNQTPGTGRVSVSVDELDAYLASPDFQRDVRKERETLKPLRDKLSDAAAVHTRQSALAGIAAVWLFKTTVGGMPHLPFRLLMAAFFFVFALVVDTLLEFAWLGTISLIERDTERFIRKGLLRRRDRAHSFMSRRVDLLAVLELLRFGCMMFGYCWLLTEIASEFGVVGI